MGVENQAKDTVARQHVREIMQDPLFGGRLGNFKKIVLLIAVIGFCIIGGKLCWNFIVFVPDVVSSVVGDSAGSYCDNIKRNQHGVGTNGFEENVCNTLTQAYKEAQIASSVLMKSVDISKRTIEKQLNSSRDRTQGEKSSISRLNWTRKPQKPQKPQKEEDTEYRW